jgi:itaconyl-CoA hydratase
MGSLAALSGPDNYFEDFNVGAVYRHCRGKTVTPLENVLITNLSMNTAAAHFDEHMMSSTPWGQVISYGGVNLSLVLGLASQDCIENALEERALDNVRLTSPVFHGDTLYSYTEVLAKADSDRDDAGLVTFRHFGVNQRDETVLQIDRTALIKRRSHWDKR